MVMTTSAEAACLSKRLMIHQRVGHIQTYLENKLFASTNVFRFLIFFLFVFTLLTMSSWHQRPKASTKVQRWIFLFHSHLNGVTNWAHRPDTADRFTRIYHFATLTWFLLSPHRNEYESNEIRYGRSVFFLSPFENVVILHLVYHCVLMLIVLSTPVSFWQSIRIVLQIQRILCGW